MLNRKNFMNYFIPWAFVSSIVFYTSVHFTYGNESNTLLPNLKVIGIVYSDSNFGFQFIASNATKQSTSEGIELVGNVTYVVDGDTLDIDEIRVRLSLVNTPERGQPGFKEAKDFFNTLCLGKKGELDVDDGQRRGDRYGREIGVVYCDGININEKLMDNALADILTEYCDTSEFANEIWATPSCS
jgi:micrococcal nuclease